MIEHKRHFLSTYFFVNPFELPYRSHDIRRELIDRPSIINYFPSTENTTILEQNNKQKLQILEALLIRNIQPKLNRMNFETSANVLKCL